MCIRATIPRGPFACLAVGLPQHWPRLASTSNTPSQARPKAACQAKSGALPDLVWCVPPCVRAPASSRQRQPRHTSHFFLQQVVYCHLPLWGQWLLRFSCSNKKREKKRKEIKKKKKNKVEGSGLEAIKGSLGLRGLGLLVAGEVKN